MSKGQTQKLVLFVYIEFIIFFYELIVLDFYASGTKFVY